MSPLTKKGKKVLKSMRKTYGSSKKAKEVFYSSMNKGKTGSASWHETEKKAHRMLGKGR